MKAIVFALLFSLPAAAQSLSNSQLTVSDNPHGAYQLGLRNAKPALIAGVAAQVDHHWLRSSDYTSCQSAASTFTDALGPGHQLNVSCGSEGNDPNLLYTLQLYDNAPYGAIQVKLHNTTSKSLTVQSLRSVDTTTPLNLGPHLESARVLSDSFSEDWPDLKIYDLGLVPDGLHRGVGSQLIYNRDSKQSLFLGALTSDRFLTILRLQTQGPGRVASYTVDSTGTTEIQKALNLDHSSADDLVELSLPVAPGETISSERVLFSVGSDYHSQLLAYGDAIRRLHHARVNSETPIGWWSWTAYYGAINEGEVLSNAEWLAQHLKREGFKFFQIDEGYQYARGEFTTTNATQFPDGLRNVGHHLISDGLTFGLWTAPFEITTRSWVYENHKDWLVKNLKGDPIPLGDVWNQHVDILYALDTTNPGAQDYLRQTYRIITREWGVRFIKLDFMDTTAIEGRYFRPNTTALEAQRIGLQIIRDTVGPDVILDKDGSPMLNPVGLVDSGRVSADTGHNFERTRAAEPGIAARFYMHRNFFINDPDAFNVTDSYLMEEKEPQPPVTLAHAQASIALSAISGGNYEIGDDLLLLGAEKERLALVENRDLLNMIRLGRAATPIDLLTYAPEDEQPSVFLLRESPRQSILVVFNWTNSPRTHKFQLTDLGLPDTNSYAGVDVFDGTTIPANNGVLEIASQPAESAKVIKLVDDKIAAAPPAITIHAPTTAKAGETIHFVADADPKGVPAVAYRWTFGDGVTTDGREAQQTYPTAGDYKIHLTVEGLDALSAQQDFTLHVTGQLAVMPQLRNNRRFEEK
ncbi:MAG TPA: PKD domain-containing protein [Candidatus Koribacter sp.]